MPGLVLRVARLRAELAAVVAGLDVDSLSGDDAVRAGDELAHIERLAHAGFLALATRVAETKSYGADGSRNAAEWAGRQLGAEPAKARRELAVAETLLAEPSTRDALLAGAISADQAQVIAPLARGRDGAARELVSMVVGRSPLRDLKARAEQLAADRRSTQADAERDAAQHRRRRFVLRRSPDGGVRGDLFLADAQGGAFVERFMGVVARFTLAARRSGSVATNEQLAADVLVDLVMGSARSADEGPESQVVVHVDVSSLLRGATEPGERCRIEGLGEVSLHAAQSLMGDSLFSVVLADATDVYAITTPRRAIPTRLRHALAARDQGRCVVPGCTLTAGLHAHHLKWWSLGGQTELANLATTCRLHHSMIHNDGWRLSGGPRHWVWKEPLVGFVPLPHAHGDRAGAVAGRAPPPP